VISGPSGSGKTCICRALALFGPVHFSVSATTRLPRPDEEGGSAYIFLSPEEFDRKRREGAFLEWACYNGCYYGTPKDSVDEAIAQGKVVILEIEVQGAVKLRESGVPGKYIFIVPPSMAVLEERLRGRGTESEEDVQQRIDIAGAEWKRAREEKIYDHFVINDSLDRAVEEAALLLGLSPKDRKS